jgi:molybdate transport system substrate-binding protein
MRMQEGLLMRMRVLAVALALLGTAGTANAAEIHAFISTALKSATDELLPRFERDSGNTVWAIFAPPGALLRRFEAGERGDVFLTGKGTIDRLIAEGKILPGRTDLGHTGIGICVRKGASKPDVASPEAFRRAMLSAKTVGYAPPSVGSVTGPHIESVFRKLGIAEAMKRKTVLAAGGPNGRVSVLVSSGQAEIGLQQASELLSNPDVEVIGMLPGDLQQTTVYSAGIITNAQQPEAARALIRALTTPGAASIFKAKGLEPQ